MNYLRSQEEHKKQFLITGIKLLHFILTIMIFYCFWILFRYGQLFPEKDVGFRYNYFTAIGFAVVLFFFNKTYNSYLLGYSRIRELAFAEALSQLFATGVIYVTASIAWNHWNNPLWFVVMMAACCGLDLLWSYFANGYYFRLYPTKKTILIYRNNQDKRRFGSLTGKPSERLYTITKELMFDGNFMDIKDTLADYEAVFVAGVNSRCRNGILKYCKEESIPGFFLPHVGDVIMQESRHLSLLFLPSSEHPTQLFFGSEFGDVGGGEHINSSILTPSALATIFKSLRLSQAPFSIFEIFGWLNPVMKPSCS